MIVTGTEICCLIAGISTILVLCMSDDYLLVHAVAMQQLRPTTSAAGVRASGGD